LASALCSFFTLDALIQAGIVIFIMIQSLPVVVALVALRRLRPEFPRPYRMPLYPLPLAVAFGGWIFIVGSSGSTYILLGLAVLLVGVAAYLWWAKRRTEWPWVGTTEALRWKEPG
jgi:hypothetical protein